MTQKDAISALREAGHRATKPRIALLSYLAGIRYPQSILDIAAALKSQMNQVTTYRILESFLESGLVREVDLHKGRPLYELAHDDHHHIVCTNCDRISEFSDCSVSTLAKRAIAQAKDFAVVNDHSIELFGLCKKCV
jgi:Fe2+ or Zn2+ uptake regulation protein